MVSQEATAASTEVIKEDDQAESSQEAEVPQVNIFILMDCSQVVGGVTI